MKDIRNGIREPKFCFESTGRYKIKFESFEHDPIEIEVVAPDKDEDKAAQALLSVPTAMFFMGEYWVEEAADKGRKNLDKIFQAHGKSAYAPYAGTGMARYHMRREDRRVSVKDCERYLNPIIEGHPKHPAHEEALYLLSKAHVDRGDHQKARGISTLLAIDHPNSSYLKDLRAKGAYSGVLPRPPQKKNKVEPDHKPANVEFLNLEKIPNGPRQVFEADWRGFAARENGAGSKGLSKSYRGINGTAEGRAKHRARLLEKNNIEWLRHEIIEASMIADYSQPRAAHSNPKAWKGDLCKIVYRTSWKRTELRTGESGVDDIKAKFIAVLAKENGKWLIVSDGVLAEDGNVRPNRLSARLSGELHMEMYTSLKTVTVYDGQGDISLHDDILSRLDPPLAADTELKYEMLSLSMKGENRSDVEIEGFVSEKSPSSASPKQRYAVTLYLVLDGERLRLTKLSATSTQDEK